MKNLILSLLLIVAMATTVNAYSEEENQDYYNLGGDYQLEEEFDCEEYEDDEDYDEEADFEAYLDELKNELSEEEFTKVKALYDELLAIEEKLMAKEDELMEILDGLEVEIYEEDCEDGNCEEEFYDEEEFDEIAKYNVINKNIVIIEEKDLTNEQKEEHKKMFDVVKKIVPNAYEKYITQFNIETDGVDNTMAYVDSEDGIKWILSLDPADAKNSKDLIETITHEFGHIVTLNNTQMKSEVDENSSTYTTDEGTTKENSYLNKFYQKFWKEIREEFDRVDSEDEAMDFYEKHEEKFVSDYAATNVEEDLAETFRVFMLEKKPTGSTVADEKVKFLYEFKELVKIRNERLSTLRIKK